MYEGHTFGLYSHIASNCSEKNVSKCHFLCRTNQVSRNRNHQSSTTEYAKLLAIPIHTSWWQIGSYLPYGVNSSRPMQCVVSAEYPVSISTACRIDTDEKQVEYKYIQVTCCSQPKAFASSSVSPLFLLANLFNLWNRISTKHPSWKTRRPILYN